MAIEKTELRGLVSTDLASVLDAMAMAKGMDRHSYVVHVLEKEVRKVAHEHMLIARVTRGNPYFSESHGSTTD